MEVVIELRQQLLLEGGPQRVQGRADGVRIVRAVDLFEDVVGRGLGERPPVRGGGGGRAPAP